MFKRRWLREDCLLLFFLFFCFIGARQGGALESERAAEILRKADESRAPWPSFTMKAITKFERRGKTVEESYRIYLKDNTQTLAAYLTPPSQKGNLLLMAGENLWYYVKETARPMRITPLQRLSGATSYGDLARLNWSQDYTPRLAFKTTITIDKISYSAFLLELAARSAAATYYRIKLWVEDETYFPRKAEVYLQSGKLFKTLYFTGFALTHDKNMNREILFIDHMNNDESTILRFEEVKPQPLPAKYFLKTALPDLSRKVAK